MGAVHVKLLAFIEARAAWEAQHGRPPASVRISPQFLAFIEQDVLRGQPLVTPICGCVVTADAAVSEPHEFHFS